ncbi:MAG TPA: tRNA (guanosine(46)-N7)-methyltransferase TrmB [Saprospiraceae bacterium]|nr:tRNA (guanosine(46)-N7)-methyltransferase TrmB [Saprospiraceae bacterium]
MSPRKKLQKFAEILKFPNVFENYDPKVPKLTVASGEHKDMKGQWNVEHFLNENPIVLELACGRGEYTLELSQMYPGKNFIGIDIKGARIWKGASHALENGLMNVAFARFRIEMIENFIGPNEVDEIWIIFPDPFLKSGKENRRLTSPYFLDRFSKILKTGGELHLKTDSSVLFEYSLSSISTHPLFNLSYHHNDIYAIDQIEQVLSIQTHYEKMHLKKGLSIKYLKAINCKI